MMCVCMVYMYGVHVYSVCVWYVCVLTCLLYVWSVYDACVYDVCPHMRDSQKLTLGASYCSSLKSHRTWSWPFGLTGWPVSP